MNIAERAGKADAAQPQPIMNEGQQAHFSEPFVDAEKAAAFLPLRPRRVLELARAGAIPAYPLGDGQRRVWRFRLSEVACAVASSHHGVHSTRQFPAPIGED
jgi:helix-turn-helix protein